MILEQLSAMTAIAATMDISGIRIEPRGDGFDIDLNCYGDEAQFRSLVTKIGSGEPVERSHDGMTWLSSDIDIGNLHIHITGHWRGVGVAVVSRAAGSTRSNS